MIKKIAIAVIALSLVGGTRRPDTPDQEYVDYGKKFSHVLKFHVEAKVYASCVVLTNEYVITAAHCIEGDEWWEVEGVKGEMHKVISASLHPTEDVAICLVDPPFEYHSFPEVMKDQEELGRVCDVAGFGCGGTFLTGHASRQDGKKRGGHCVVGEIWDGNILACPANDRVRLAFCVSPGDSGGGLFIDGKLAGVCSEVTSCGGKPSAYGCYSLHVRVSKIHEWIQQEISSSR